MTRIGGRAVRHDRSGTDAPGRWDSVDDHEAIGFRRAMSGKACHEATTQLQDRRPVVSRGRLDARQQESDGADRIERIFASSVRHDSRHG